MAKRRDQPESLFVDEPPEPELENLEWDSTVMMSWLNEQMKSLEVMDDSSAFLESQEYFMEILRKSEPQYDHYIDPVSGEVSPVDGNRQTFSPFLMSAAMSRKEINFPEPAIHIPTSPPWKSPPFSSEQPKNEEEENIYEEKEEEPIKIAVDNGGVGKPISDDEFVRYMREEDTEEKAMRLANEAETAQKKKKARKPAKSEIIDEQDLEKKPRIVKPIRKSKWTPPPEDNDGLLPGVRETNKLLKQMWAEKGARGEPFVKNTDIDLKADELSSADDAMWVHQRGPRMRRDYDKKFKHLASSESALAMAAAEFGQIKLFGKEPTVTESMLAKARKEALKDERLDMEEELKKRIGIVGYVKQFCGGYPKDTSLAAVEASLAEGRTILEIVTEMMLFQTDLEFRTMMSAMDVRIRRDPLEWRMTTDQIKRVWGGDPVMPAVGYEVDKDRIVDFLGPEFHEPAREPFELVIESGKAIRREDLEKIFEREKLMNQKAMAAAKQEKKSRTKDLAEIEEDDVILLDESEDEDEEEEEEVVLGVGDEEDIAELEDDDVAVTGPRMKLVGPLGDKSGSLNVTLVSEDFEDTEEKKEEVEEEEEEVLGAIEEEEEEEEEKEEETEEDNWFEDFQAFMAKGEGKDEGGNGPVNGRRR